MPKPDWLRADFNGVFGDILCLSHRNTAMDYAGHVVVLEEGMHVTAFDDDMNDEGQPDALCVTGVVERSPEWLRAARDRCGRFA